MPETRALAADGSSPGLSAPEGVPPKVTGPPTARGDEEAYQAAIKQRAAHGEALTPDQIFRRARDAKSLAV